MNELEKCMAGEWYDCHDKIFLEYKNNARSLLAQYNSLAYDQKEESKISSLVLKNTEFSRIRG